MEINSNVQKFRNLHKKEEIFLLPNAWDVSSALVFEGAGFEAVGTTSWGIASSLGYVDGEFISLEETLLITERILKSTKAPINVDMESGYSNDVDEISKNVQKVMKLGAAGINIEDMNRGAEQSIRDIGLQSEIIKEVTRVVTRDSGDIFINARIDTYLSGLFSAEDLVSETIQRANAYVEAGAECIFVPGATDPEQIQIICHEINAPVNIMALPGATNAESLLNLGVKRLSIGFSAYNAALAAIHADAIKFKEQGDASHYYDVQAPDLKLSQ